MVLSISKNKTNTLDTNDLKYTDALHRKGISLYELQNYTGALEYFDKALAIDPNDKFALESKGESLFQLANDT
ncbi:MAG TPA: tetratricopeptide repeat protein, partial [Nitrososphaeraceae archaeon]